MGEMKKVLILLLLLSFCGGNNAVIDETATVEESTTTTSTSTTTSTLATTSTVTTTTATLAEKVMTLDDYLGEAFAPSYSPNELLRYEKDMYDHYFSNTRNKLIEESIINLTITETTEYKNTVILGDDVVCEEDEFIIENANEDGVSPEEYCNKLVTVSDWNYIRYPIFKNEVPSIFKNTSFDEKPIGKCLDSLNEEIYSFVYSLSDFYYKDVKETKDLGFKNWHRNIFSGDFQVTWISPRSEKGDGSVKYGNATFISGMYPSPASFFLDEIGAEPEEYGVVSIVFDFYKYYAGAANGQWFVETLNYDLVNCKKINLDDIFSNKNLSADIYDGDILIPQSYPEEVLDIWFFQETDAWVYALKYEYSKVQCLLDDDFCDELENMDLSSPPDKEFFSDFAFDSNGLIFYFDKYQIACGGCNVPFPLIQFERLFRILDFNNLGKK